MWQLLLLLFVSGPDAEKNRSRAGHVLLAWLVLSLLGGGFALATTAAAGRAVGRITRGLVVGIAKAFIRFYFHTVPAAVAKAAVKSLVWQVLPGTITLDTWLSSYDTQGHIRRGLEAGTIAEEDPDNDTWGILQTPRD